jgi:DNA repair protein RecN (Recombination protein N)
MLTTLRIKNLALVSDLTLELQPGYNAITGETGAGKSIIIGALNLLLGDRADRNAIRGGSDSCSIEAIFDISRIERSIQSVLQENGFEPCEDNQLILKRAFTNSGVNRQFINGSVTTLSQLGALGEWLVDMHGPHDHQSLLHSNRQLDILDAFGNLHSLRENFATLLRRRTELQSEKAALIVDEKTYAQQLDLLRFQFNEIKSANLHPDEEPQLDEEYQRSSNATRLFQLTQSAINTLSDEEISVTNQLGHLGRTLQDLSRLDPGTVPLLQLQEQAASILQELQSELSHYLDRLEMDPVRFQELEERLNLVQKLKRKYGASLAEIIEFGQAALRKLIDLEQRDEQVIRLEREIRQINSELWNTGRDLGAQRRKLIPKLAKAVRNQLEDLAFKQCLFDIAIHSVSDPSALESHHSPSGLDTVEFQFAPNTGEPARPLRAIASSGEMARVMLALKTVLAFEDQIPVLVFDEVDANIGGETAHAVGEKMRQIARQRQVLCITHLAPVAAAASAHFVVTKQVKSGRTLSEIRFLNDHERVDELARMLGGQSDAARNHAQSLIHQNSM